MTAASTTAAPAIRTALVGLLALILSFAALPGQARGADGADAFMRDFAGEAITLLRDDSVGPEQRAEAFHRFLTTKFDLDLVSRYVLGRHWNQASESERAEYRRLFETFIVATYARRLDAYNGETLEVAHTRDLRRGDVSVETLLHRPEGAPVQVAWRLRPQDGGGWRIIDIVIEGVSMVVTQRSEFAAVIQQHGNRVSGLIETLRARIAAAGSLPLEREARAGVSPSSS